MARKRIKVVKESPTERNEFSEEGAMDTTTRIHRPNARLKSYFDYAVSIVTVALLGYVVVSWYRPGTADPLAVDVAVGKAIPTSILTEDPEIIAIVSPTCVYCKRSVPAWNELVRIGFRVVGFSSADPDPFVQETKPQFPIRQVAVSDFAELGISRVPRTLGVAEGAVVFVHRGLLSDASQVFDALGYIPDPTGVPSIAGDVAFSADRAMREIGALLNVSTFVLFGATRPSLADRRVLGTIAGDSPGDQLLPVVLLDGTHVRVLPSDFAVISTSVHAGVVRRIVSARMEGGYALTAAGDVLELPPPLTEIRTRALMEMARRPLSIGELSEDVLREVLDELAMFTESVEVARVSRGILALFDTTCLTCPSEIEISDLVRAVEQQERPLTLIIPEQHVASVERTVDYGGMTVVGYGIDTLFLYDAFAKFEALGLSVPVMWDFGVTK